MNKESKFAHKDSKILSPHSIVTAWRWKYPMGLETWKTPDPVVSERVQACAAREARSGDASVERANARMPPEPVQRGKVTEDMLLQSHI